MTLAKIGRSMKNRENMDASAPSGSRFLGLLRGGSRGFWLCCLGFRGRSGRGLASQRLGVDLGAGAGFLEPVDDHAIVGLQPFLDDHQAVLVRADLDPP